MKKILLFVVLATTFSSHALADDLVIPHDFDVCGHKVGGWSDIVWEGDQLWAVDDSRDATKLWALSWETLDVINHCEAVRLLVDEAGTTGFDAEGMTYDGHSWWVSSEGGNPRIMRFNQHFEYLDELNIQPIVERFVPQDNKAFEAIDVTDTTVFTAFEEPPILREQQGSRVTLIFSINRITETLQVYNYRLEERPTPRSSLGLVAMVALDDQHLLSLERSYTPREGNQVSVYYVALDEHVSCEAYQCVKKTHWFDLGQFSELAIDNIEGMALTPSGDLVFVSDNNFSRHQQTQIIRLSLSQLPSLPQ